MLEVAEEQKRDLEELVSAYNTQLYAKESKRADNSKMRVKEQSKDREGLVNEMYCTCDCDVMSLCVLQTYCATSIVTDHLCVFRLAMAVGRPRGRRSAGSNEPSLSEGSNGDDVPQLTPEQWTALDDLENVYLHQLPEVNADGEFLIPGTEKDCTRMSEEQKSAYETHTISVWALELCDQLEHLDQLHMGDETESKCQGYVETMHHFDACDALTLLILLDLLMSTSYKMEPSCSCSDEVSMGGCG